ncbi:MULTISPECIES: hypothetical protein [unclassified Flavobacterium]|uniref:hypothetical protein n=1 Tax=unclassified Flavobacterium TaxID=196869 RepID=UPI000F0C89FB|nr:MULTISPECIES: hypothetical protein [unclassified Flavobacterium]AYN03374.1 hypothetical protein EAG11_03695 [Flavobacterium sp. 140616W15]MCD0476055.1 hypothetical protein [Flavobacterium sp. EDS]
MKSKIIVLMLIAIVSCSGQEIKYNFKLTKIKISQLNSDYKKVDLTLYNQYKIKLEKSNENDLAISNKSKSSFKNYFYKSYDSYHLDEYDKNKKLKETKVNFDNSVDITENIDEYFDYYETYFSNGNIKSKLISSWLGFSVGKSYKYDENGNILEVKDWDEDYKFTFNNVLVFLDKMSIKIQKPSPIQISKTNTNGIKTWSILFPNIVIKKNITYILSGLDGSVINQHEESLPSFKHKDF